MSTMDCTGLILTGGHSRRFGTDKAKYPVAGKTMLDRVYLALSSVLCPMLISTRDAEQIYEIPARHVIDLYPEMGPLAGIHAGLVAAETPWVFVSAVDMPFINAELIQMLLEERSEKTIAVIAQSDGRLQPLFGCYHASLIPTLEERLEAGLLSATRFAVETGARIVDLSDTGLLNVNTKDDMPSQ